MIVLATDRSIRFAGIPRKKTRLLFHHESFSGRQCMP
jgi:hypothetical protein